MQVYADYAFYKDVYHGDMAKEEFDRHAISATQYIRYLTMNKSDSYQGEELKYATCAAADLYYSAAQDMERQSGRVKSENTDGYSVSYVAEGKDGETNEDLISRKVYTTVRKYLLSTGLLNRRVRCVYACKCVSDHI